MKYIDLDRQCGLPQFDSHDVIRNVATARDGMAIVRHDQRVLGTVRGGSTGAVIDNNIYGVCHRIAYLRYKGVETPLDPEIELMTAQGEQNEEIWLAELREFYKGSGIVVKDQNEFECTWTLPGGIAGSGSPDVTLWDGSTPVLGLELKNISSVSNIKSTHYELRPKEDHIIQAANYSLRMGDQYCNGNPLPYKLIYSNRVVWHFFNMAEKVKQIILEKGWDINYSFGRPNTVQPFHREYLLDWNPDGTLRYWTAGLKNWVDTKLTRESIDRYYTVVAKKIEEDNTLGPRPTSKHLDGKAAYSPCGYCDFKSVCDIGDRITPDEFVDRAQVLADELWKKRGK